MPQNHKEAELEHMNHEMLAKRLGKPVFKKEGWTPRQHEFWYILSKIIEYGTYSRVMNDIIYSYWKAEQAMVSINEDKESLAWGQAWDILRELNETIGKAKEAQDENVSCKTDPEAI